MANKPTSIDEILNEMGVVFQKSVDSQVAGMPDSLDDAIDAAQTSRKLNTQTQKISKGTLTSGSLTGTSGNSLFWEEEVRKNAIAKNIAPQNVERQKWLKETEHNRLIAYTEANRLAIEVYKSTVSPGGLVDTTEEIIKSAAMIAAFLNEGYFKK